MFGGLSTRLHDSNAAPLPCAAAQGRAKATWATEGPHVGRAARLEVQAAGHSDEEEADVIDISQVGLHEPIWPA